MPTATSTHDLPSAAPCRLTARKLPERVHQAYTALYQEFADWTPSEAFRVIFRMSVLEELRRRVSDGEQVSVLEVGCGHGTWASEIYAETPGADERVSYLGIDFTEPRIDLARQRLSLHPSARFIVADGDRFEPRAAVDLVLGIEVISHVQRRRHATWLRRWYNWLAPGGSAIIIDKDRFTRHALRLGWDVFKWRWFPRSLNGPRYYFSEHFGDYASTICYPSFAALRRKSARAGFSPRPLLRHRFFRALLLDKAAE